MVALHRFIESPDPILRPFAGGEDRPFNTRWRDVIVGTTKPDATNTGVWNPDALVAAPGLTNTGEAFYENLALSGRFIQQAATGDVTLYNCSIDMGVIPGAASASVVNTQYPSARLRLIDCTISGSVSTYLLNGVNAWNVEMLRCHVRDVVDGVQVRNHGGAPAGGPVNVSIKASYFHSLMYYSPDPTHADTDNRTHNDMGVQLLGGTGVEFIGNNVVSTESSFSFVDTGGFPSEGIIGQGFTITPIDALVDDVLIESNWFDHGMRGVIAEGSAAYFGDNIVVRNNRFGPNILDDPAQRWGGMAARSTFGIHFEGNVDFDGNPVEPIYFT